MAKARSGQVVLYFILVLVAITILAVMNVGIYLAVTMKNQAMNAGDFSALAVAKKQGELLNEIGELNIEHLKLALEATDPAELEDALSECDRFVACQARLCFLGPLNAIQAGNVAAKANGVSEPNTELHEVLKQHVVDIRMTYATTPDAYPEPWDGAWEEYAQAFEVAISEPLYAGPDNIEFIDAATGHLLLKREFYDAIAGRNWCWFHLSGGNILDSYTNFHDWKALPHETDDDLRRLRCQNCEVYSLHLETRVGSAVELLGTNLICRLTGKTEADIAHSLIITNTAQIWYFYDVQPDGEGWCKWREMDLTDAVCGLPLVGSVKPEYDVRGAAAICRVSRNVPNVLGTGKDRVAVWSAAAKPFGTVENEDGETAVLTSIADGFVTPVSYQAKLVPLDSVGGRDLATADAEWMRHLRNDLSAYLENGPNALSDCYYCQQLVAWERSSLREHGRRWLKYHSSSCVRPTGGGSGHGGTPHGH